VTSPPAPPAKPHRAASAKALPPPPPEPLPGVVFDAHTHLDAMAQRAGLAPDAAFVAGAMAAARAVGVIAAVTVADTLESARWVVRAAQGHRDVYAAVAVHPTEVRGLDDAGYAELRCLAEDPRVVAVGETGLDYYWDRTTPPEQQQHFRRHIRLAKDVGKALMIHDREAHADVLRILAEEGAPDQVVFHAFSGDVAMAQACVDAGYVLSFPGVVTFTNAPGLRAAAAVVPPALILVETDAPFLTPHPFRGRPNAPYLLPFTVAEVALATGCSLSALCAQVMTNGQRVFGDRFTPTSR
jgi:TatD DNase family protein